MYHENIPRYKFLIGYIIRCNDSTKSAASFHACKYCEHFVFEYDIDL